MNKADRGLENTVRRIASRRGYRLEKCRRRDSQELGYGGYMLVELHRRVVILGARPHAYAATLVEVKQFLASE